MTVNEAIQTMRGYPCVCEFGSSPFKCTDDKCPFGEAIRTLVNEVEQAHNSLLNEEESERLLDFIGDDTGLHERAVSDLNDTVADILRKCKRGDV